MCLNFGTPKVISFPFLTNGKLTILGVPIHLFNPIALRMAKTLWSFGHSECNRVKNIMVCYAHHC